MKERLSEFRDRLRSCGLKVTPQRLAIFEVLAKTEKHPDVENIFAEIREIHPELSLATVYSNLKSLQKIGLVREIGTFGGIRRFDGRVEPHPHLICIDCNKIEDLVIDKKDIEEVESFVAGNTKYKLIKNSLSFYGCCSDCNNKIKKRR